MAQRILGLDLGAAGAKGVLVESTYRGFTVVDWARSASPPGDGGRAEGQAAAVSSLLQERGWAFDSVVVAYPGAGVSTHALALPFTDARRIAEAVGFEVEGQIPFDLADVAWDWQQVGTSGGRADLMVAVVRKADLAGLLAALAGAGVDPRAVVPAAPALATLLASGVVAPPPEGAAGADLLLDVGFERTALCVAEGGVLETARTFPFGGAHLARALARELSIAEADAVALLASESRGEPAPPGLLEAARDPRAADVVRRALAPLVREVRSTLRAWRTRAGARPVRRALLAGEPGRLPGLPEILAPEIDGPVAPLELGGPAVRLAGAAGSPFALALALALRGHVGGQGPRLNLRRGDLAFTRDFEHVRGKVTRLAAWAALVLLLAVAGTAVKGFALSRREAALDRALCDAQQKLLGKCYDDFEQAQAVLRGHGIPGASVPRVSAVEILGELSVRVPDAVPVRFDRIEVTREKLHLQGITDAAENVDKIVTALGQSRCFADARSGGARRRGQDQKFEFSIDSGLSCLEGAGEEPGKER